MKKAMTMAMVMTKAIMLTYYILMMMTITETAIGSCDGNVIRLMMMTNVSMYTVQ